ncbi:MAG: acyl-CoA dehydrogenase family protein, partial [Myxococcales bacterium]|nr:acyl-CoA dehydrogenase family protein [Myxococcales bacterium]
MDFQLSDEQLALRDTAHRFAAEEIVPVAAEYDQKEEFPRDLIEKAWHLGLMSLVIPESYGGTGLGMQDACLIYEEIAWGCAGVA